MARDCPHGDCVVAKTEQFLAVLRDPAASRGAKAEALKYVVHFIGDLHQPLHDETNGDKGGNARQVLFDGHPDNLHWVWDTGLLQHLGRNPRALAAVGKTPESTPPSALLPQSPSARNVPFQRRPSHLSSRTSPPIYTCALHAYICWELSGGSFSRETWVHGTYICTGQSIRT
jgi:hypothetical protein